MEQWVKTTTRSLVLERMLLLLPTTRQGKRNQRLGYKKQQQKKANLPSKHFPQLLFRLVVSAFQICLPTPTPGPL
jgi:hypothetical protein